MLYHDLGDVVTKSLVVGHFRVEADGSLVEVSKVKMSTMLADGSISWAGRGVLAITTGEMSVRLWNLDTRDNFVLIWSTGTGGHRRDQPRQHCHVAAPARPRKQPRHGL